MPWGRHLGGVPISHNALQHYPEFHGADTWGGTLLGGTLLRGVPCPGSTLPGGLPCWKGGTLLGGYPGRVPPLARMGGTLLGWYPAGGYPASGVPCQGEGTQVGSPWVGQQKEYSLHSRWYASCVHAGGLSCFLCI